MKLGSLFSGSGGFELAGAINGIEPVWASEIEPYPIKVTKARFPQMKHLGSVLDVNGAEVEPVDIITFGSPCQDLSVAGKQAGLHKGERSSLFFEAIRIIKEMRRSTDGIYPRIAVWENVPGAYSSNKGEDFRAVLEAFCSVKDETADVPRPAAGKWNPAGAIVGNGWSIAWRTFDAQYWGVPQRRKRIYLIADFGSERAGEILFEQEGLRWHSAESGTAGEGAAGDAAGSAGRGVQCLNPSMPQSSRIYSADGVYPCLSANETGGLNRQAVLFEPMSALEENWAESSVKNAMRAGASKSSHAVCAYDIGEARLRNPQEYIELSPTLTQHCGTGGNNTPAVCYAVRTRNTMANGWGVAENAYTLDTSEGQAVAYSVDSVCYAIDRASFNQGINAKYDICIEPELNSPLVARGPSAVCYPIDSHQQDSRFKVCADGISPTLPGQMVTGGNNGPMVLQPVVYSAGNGQADNSYLTPEVAQTLNCLHDQQIACYEKCECYGCNWDGTQISGTMTRNNAGGNQRMPDKGNFNAVIVPGKPPRKYIIRRLTPLEASRLQGFPGIVKLEVGLMTRDEIMVMALALGFVKVDFDTGKIYRNRGPGGMLTEYTEREGFLHPSGYKYTTININGIRKQCRVNRLVWTAAHGKIPDGYVVAHINNDKTDNRLSNLELLTPEQNSHNAKRDGLYLTGDDCPQSKVTVEQSKEIAEIWAFGRKSTIELAKMYGISKSRVQQIVHEFAAWDGDVEGSDSARYRLWGNGIALPNAAYVIGCAKKLIQEA